MKTFVAAFVATSAATVASLGLGGATAHGARTQRLVGTIAFLRDPGHPGGNESLLYVIHPDGSGLKRVTPPATPVLRYAWSPNGQLIAYIDERRQSLWLIRRDGTQLRRLLAGSRLASEGLSWSPDGTKIAITSRGPYAQYRTGRCSGQRIYVVTIHRSQPRLLRGTSACGNPAWSPGGNQIAYSGGGDGIWVIRPDGSGRRRVSPRGWIWVGWSADGRQLAFGVTAGEDFYGGPAAVDANGRHYHLVTTNGYTEYPAEWSPQGRRILYGRTQHRGIYAIGANGQHDVRLTSDWPEENLLPKLAWAPDGRSIVYARHTGHGDLYVLGADGHGKVQLTNSPHGDFAPSWVAH